MLKTAQSPAKLAFSLGTSNRAPLYLGHKLGGYRPGGYRAFLNTAEFKQGLENLEKD